MDGNWTRFAGHRDVRLGVLLHESSESEYDGYDCFETLSF